MTLAEKVCTHCSAVKPAAAFERRAKVASGLASWCRVCRLAYGTRVGAARRRARKEAIIALKGGACEACGGTFPHYVYDLHHRDPSTKETGMTDLQDKAWSRVLAELEKCDLLCANCHRVAHHASTVIVHFPLGGNAEKTVCNSGHPLSGDNVYRYRGDRHCRACNRDRVAEYKQRKRSGSPQ